MSLWSPRPTAFAAGCRPWAKRWANPRWHRFRRPLETREGVAVGAVTVGVALSGNIAGLTPEDLAGLPEAERDALGARGRVEKRRDDWG